MLNWLENVFPNIFDEIVLGKSEKMSLYTENIPNPIIDSTKSDVEKMKSYMVDEYSFDNLSRGFSLNFFNILVNNLVRLNIRKSIV